jgi:hypothetical protein
MCKFFRNALGKNASVDERDAKSYQEFKKLKVPNLWCFLSLGSMQVYSVAYNTSKKQQIGTIK